VKPKVETKVEQSGTWLKALAEAAAKMVPMVVRHRPTQSTTSPLPITNPTPAVVTTTRLPIQSPQTMIPCEEFEVLHWQQNMTPSLPYSSSLAIQTLTLEQYLRIHLGFLWEHDGHTLGTREKTKNPSPPTPWRRKNLECSQKSLSPFLAWANTPCKEHPTLLACSHMWAVQQGSATEINRDIQE